MARAFFTTPVARSRGQAIRGWAKSTSSSSVTCMATTCGNAHIKEPNSGTCANPDTLVSALPNSNAVNIALAKKAKIVTGSEMPPFFAGKLKANGGEPDGLDPRALRRQREGRRSDDRDGDRDAQQRPRSRLHWRRAGQER